MQNTTREAASYAGKSHPLMWVLTVLGLVLSTAAVAYTLVNVVSIWSAPASNEWQNLSSPVFVAQWIAAVLGLGIVIVMLLRTWLACLRGGRSFLELNDLALYIARGMFWALILVGGFEIILTLPETFYSNLPSAYGETLGAQLTQSAFRGSVFHIPLVSLGFVIGAFLRGPHFVWLALGIVLAQLFSTLAFQVFQLSNTYLSDLIRLWYSGLFLLSAAYTLFEGGHVRVDVVFAGLSARAKAWVNFVGSFVFGLPLATIMLYFLTRNPEATVNNALKTFDRGNAGVGLVSQYLVAFTFMVVATVLIIQFSSYMAQNGAKLLGLERDEPSEGAN